MTRRLLPLIATIACTEALPPERSDTYSFIVDCSIEGVCTSEADPDLRLIFRWPEDALPVRVWVEPQADLPRLARSGVDRWERALLYGEFRAIMVGDSSRADVIILYGPPATIFGVNGDTPRGCKSETHLAVATADTSIVLPFRVIVAPRLGAEPQEVSACLESAVAHELGHAFGLFLDSPSDADLMFERPQVSELSRADLSTFAALYHSVASVRLPPGR